MTFTNKKQRRLFADAYAESNMASEKLCDIAAREKADHVEMLQVQANLIKALAAVIYLNEILAGNPEPKTGG